jgi:hypothetical protein
MGAVNEELHPYILYRLQGGQVECAIWQIKDGPKALALFLSGDSATAYRSAAHLGTEWQIFRPARDAFLHLLKACFQAEIRYVVLEPDLEKAKRIFDINEILMAVESLGNDPPVS